jgi:hypothetical protein
MESGPEGCYSIVYSSSAIADFGEADLVKLLKQARGFNEQAGITGALMYSGGRFMHVLEGCPAAVCALYARIATDPYHGCIEKLADGFLPQREFKEWTMSFAPPPAGWRELPGYLTPPQQVLSGIGTSAQPLLSEFMAAGASQLPE